MAVPEQDLLQALRLTTTVVAAARNVQHSLQFSSSLVLHRPPCNAIHVSVACPCLVNNGVHKRETVHAAMKVSPVILLKDISIEK